MLNHAENLASVTGGMRVSSNSFRLHQVRCKIGVDDWLPDVSACIALPLPLAIWAKETAFVTGVLEVDDGVFGWGVTKWGDSLD